MMPPFRWTIEPHRAALVLFWDASNLEAMTKAWHDSEKRRIEKADIAAGRQGGGEVNSLEKGAPQTRTPLTRRFFIPPIEGFQHG